MWKEPETITDYELDDYEQKIAFCRLPLPLHVKEKMLDIWANGGNLEDAVDAPLTEEEKNKIYNSKYIDEGLNQEYKVQFTEDFTHEDLKNMCKCQEVTEDAPLFCVGCDVSLNSGNSYVGGKGCGYTITRCKKCTLKLNKEKRDLNKNKK